MAWPRLASVVPVVLILVIAAACTHLPLSGARFRVGPIAEGDGFSALTPMESKRDSLGKKRHPQRPRYRDNRARLQHAIYVNNTLENDETRRMPGGFPMSCACVLEKDGAISIHSALWLYSGVALELRVSRDSAVTGEFAEVVHMQNIYKTALFDSALVDNVRVPLQKRDLLLAAAPRFKVGESVSGLLTFASAPYYRSAEFKPGFAKEGGGYSASPMNTVRAEGTLRFVCTLMSPETHAALQGSL